MATVTLRDENRRLECPPNGTVLQVVGGPDEFQGQRFWALSGFGWFNETYLAFHHEGFPPYPEREELADQGLIAYVGPDQGLWLMKADGSDRHRINRGPVLTQPQPARKKLIELPSKNALQQLSILTFARTRKSNVLSLGEMLRIQSRIPVTWT